MPEFPKSETQIEALYYRMVKGYSIYLPHFPSIKVAGRQKLFNTGRDFLIARSNLKDVLSNLRLESKIKNEKFTHLINTMRKCLQKAEVDTITAPEKLKLIGWSPRRSSKALKLPGQPENLKIEACEQTSVKIKWDNPLSGGKVQNYIIEKRLLNSTCSDWTIEEISYKCNMNLRNQPKDILIEYRVIASNKSGFSLPSNTVTLTL